MQNGRVSVTLLGTELRPVVVSWVFTTGLVGRSRGDGLGRDRRLDRGLNVCLGVGDSAGCNGVGGTGVSGGRSVCRARTTAGRVVFLVMATTAAAVGGRTGRRRGRRGGRGGRRRAVRATCHRQHSRHDGDDAECQRRPAVVRAIVNANGISLSSQSYDMTVRFIPTCTQPTGNRTAVGSFRRACCQPAELTGSMGRWRSAAGASAGTTGCSGGIGASRLYGSPCTGRWST
jgi:hypothetical protein